MKNFWKKFLNNQSRKKEGKIDLHIAYILFMKQNRNEALFGEKVKNSFSCPC